VRHRSEQAGFTAVVCTAPGCGVGDRATVAHEVVDVLRDAVRASRHGVLVSTGCLCGAPACRQRAAAPIVVIQPCDAERRPSGRALPIGPLRTSVDVDTLGAWLRGGQLDPGLLPAHLLGLYRRAIAPLN
jgi:hypothetical protein